MDIEDEISQGITVIKIQNYIIICVYFTIIYATVTTHRIILRGIFVRDGRCLIFVDPYVIFI